MTMETDHLTADITGHRDLVEIRTDIIPTVKGKHHKVLRMDIIQIDRDKCPRAKGTGPGKGTVMEEVREIKGRPTDRIKNQEGHPTIIKTEVAASIKDITEDPGTMEQTDPETSQETGVETVTEALEEDMVDTARRKVMEGQVDREIMALLEVMAAGTTAQMEGMEDIKVTEEVMNEEVIGEVASEEVEVEAGDLIIVEDVSTEGVGEGSVPDLRRRIGRPVIGRKSGKVPKLERKEKGRPMVGKVLLKAMRREIDKEIIVSEKRY